MIKGATETVDTDLTRPDVASEERRGQDSSESFFYGKRLKDPGQDFLDGLDIAGVQDAFAREKVQEEQFHRVIQLETSGNSIDELQKYLNRETLPDGVRAHLRVAVERVQEEVMKKGRSEAKYARHLREQADSEKSLREQQIYLWTLRERIEARKEHRVDVLQEAVRAMASAAALGDVEMLRQMLDDGMSPDAKTSNGNTNLHLASHQGHLAAVQLLISKGANVDEQDKHGNTPLMQAVKKGRKDVVAALLDGGADIGIKNHRGRSALDCALRGKNETHRDIECMICQVVEKQKKMKSKVRRDFDACCEASCPESPSAAGPSPKLQKGPGSYILSPK